MSEIERTTIRKVAKRLLPFIFLLYIVCLIDRVNLSFAALTMNRDVGLNAYVYGLGASIFFTSTPSSPKIASLAASTPSRLRQV